jgi:hypothetical protein
LHSAYDVSISAQDWAHSIGIQFFVEKFNQQKLLEALLKCIHN